MFMIVEGRNCWSAEEKFIDELKSEVGCTPLVLNEVVGSQSFLAHIRAKPVLVDFLFVSGILALVDCRSPMDKENREACSWFVEHRKAENEHIVLSDVFEYDFIDARVRRLVTYRVSVSDVADVVYYRVMNLRTGRSVSGKLDEGLILEAVKKSGEPLTAEEVEQREEKLKQFLSEEGVK